MALSGTNEKRTAALLTKCVSREHHAEVLPECHRFTANDQSSRLYVLQMTDGYGGHTQVLAFFDCAQTPGNRRTNASAECLAPVKSKIEDARCQTNRILTSVGNIPRGGSRVGTPPEL
jgi:hypothetical protein